jgi:hypothetical protein
MLIHAVRLPLAFLFGTSFMVRPIVTFSRALLLLAHVVKWQTWRQALLELLGAVGVLEDEGVEVSLASDLELDVVCLLALLDARRCAELLLANCKTSTSGKGLLTGCVLAAADLDELLDI